MMDPIHENCYKVSKSLNNWMPAIYLCEIKISQNIGYNLLTQFINRFKDIITTLTATFLNNTVSGMRNIQQIIPPLILNEHFPENQS